MLTDASSSERQIGFIAQNLETQFPWLVNTDTAGKKEVNYGGMTPIIVSAIQELVEKLASISLRIDHLFEQIVTFTKTVIFQKSPIYEDRDVAGFATIRAGDQMVKIEFETPYEDTPVVTISPIGSTTFAYIDELDKRGFTIHLDTPASTDKRFSWMTLLVRGARTISSDGTSSVAPSSSISTTGTIDSALPIVPPTTSVDTSITPPMSPAISTPPIIVEAPSAS